MVSNICHVANAIIGQWNAISWRVFLSSSEPGLFQHVCIPNLFLDSEVFSRHGIGPRLNMRNISEVHLPMPFMMLNLSIISSSKRLAFTENRVIAEITDTAKVFNNSIS